MIDYRKVPEGIWFDAWWDGLEPEKDFRKFRYFPDCDRFFINIAILPRIAQLAAMNESCVMATDVKDGEYVEPILIDASWVINEVKGKIGEHLERVINELRNNEDFHKYIAKTRSEYAVHKDTDAPKT